MGFFRSLFRRSGVIPRTESRVEFLDEQVGPAESALKSAVHADLARFPGVQRAYLARVAFQPEVPSSVALCLRARAADDRVVRQLYRRFAEQFSRDAFLDIMFLTPLQEQDLRRVCRRSMSLAIPALLMSRLSRSRRPAAVSLLGTPLFRRARRLPHSGSTSPFDFFPRVI